MKYSYTLNEKKYIFHKNVVESMNGKRPFMDSDIPSKYTNYYFASIFS